MSCARVMLIAKNLSINTLNMGIILIVIDESRKKIILGLHIPILMKPLRTELSMKTAGPDKFLKAKIASS